MTPEQKKAYDDATKVAQQAASMIGGTYTPQGGFVKNVPPPTGGMQPGSSVQNQGQPGYDVFGNPVAPSTPQPTTPSTPTPEKPTDQQNIDTKQAEAETLSQKRLQAAEEANTQMTGIQNGSIPLSAGENAQIEGLKQQFNQLIEQQKLTNTGATGTANIRGYQQGAAEYDANFQTNIISSVISAGANKVADLNVKLASAVATLTQALKDNKIKGIKDAYTVLDDARKERQTAIQKTVDDVQKKIKEAQDLKQKQDEAEAKVEAELRDDINAVLTNYTKNGGNDPKEIEAIQNSSNLGEAMANAGGFLYSENDKLDAQYKKQQIAKMKNDMALDWEKLKLDKSKFDAEGGASGVDPGLMIAYAQEYAANGKIPTGLPKGTFGIVAQTAKELPKTPGQIISVNTGVSPSGDDAYQSGLGSLYSATELAKQLKELDKERWGGLVSGTLGKVFGSEKQTKYMDLRSQIVDLLSRARSGAALTPSEEKRYGDMLPGRFSETLNLGADSDVKIDNFINALTSDAKNKASSKGWAINGVSDVKLGGKTYKVSDVIDINGVKGRVNADGSITQI